MDSKFIKNNNSIDLYGQSMVFHCNHYNRFLQQTIEDADYINYEKILVKSCAEVVFEQLSEYFNVTPNLDLKQKLQFASDMFKYCGFGLLDFSATNFSGGKVIGKISHYGNALKLNFGQRKHAGEYFDKGFILGTIGAISGTLSGQYFADDIKIKQHKSVSLGEDYCEFELELDENIFTKDFSINKEIPDRKIPTNIDENLIIDTVSQMPLIGDDEGLIPAFGVYLTRMYADYYNKISFRFEEELKKETGTYDLAKDLLIEAGRVCAFNTFGGIMLSDPWKALIKPMIETKEDWLHGILGVVNCLGWGVWRIEELVPNEKLVLRAYQDYESLGYLKWFGKADRNISYLLTGGSEGLMNLLYNGDITKEPELTKKYYYELFNDGNYFRGTQTKCLAKGDEYSEVVVTRG